MKLTMTQRKLMGAAADHPAGLVQTQRGFNGRTLVAFGMRDTKAVRSLRNAGLLEYVNQWDESSTVRGVRHPVTVTLWRITDKGRAVLAG